MGALLDVFTAREINGSVYAVHYCPTHAVAEEAVALARAVAHEHDDAPTCAHARTVNRLSDQARALLARLPEAP